MPLPIHDIIHLWCMGIQVGLLFYPFNRIHLIHIWIYVITYTVCGSHKHIQTHITYNIKTMVDCSVT